MTWSLVRRFESSEHETYMIFLYDIKVFYGPLIVLSVRSERHQYTLKYVINESREK